MPAPDDGIPAVYGIAPIGGGMQAVACVDPSRFPGPSGAAGLAPYTGSPPLLPLVVTPIPTAMRIDLSRLKH